MAKRRWVSKKVWGVVIFGFVVALGIGLFVVSYVQQRQILDFTYYEPSYLPPGVSVKAKRIAVMQYGINNEHKIVSAELNFRTEDWVYGIQEWKDEGDAIASAQQDYDESSIGPTCSFYDSAKGQRYRLCHWIDYGRIDVHEVKFKRGGVSFWVHMPSEIQNKISVEEISNFVDSFTPKDASGLPVLRTTGA